MTIQLPANLESQILEAVHSGRYASLDDAMAEAASLLVQRLQQEQSRKVAATASAPADRRAASPKQKPLWERAAELRRSIPEEEWAKLPADGAEQLDHYIYGSPKRPTS
jgi:Arc/MetJ-type ribon-helix-helix transcriptional regulator